MRPASLLDATQVVGNLQSGHNVSSIVPPVFEAYARIFHPVGVEGSNHKRVTWAEVARANGKTAHRAMQFSAIVPADCFDEHGLNKRHGQPGLWDYAPLDGELPEEVAQPLSALLAKHTSSAERCYFAYWNGYGDAITASFPTFKANEGRQQDIMQWESETGKIFRGSPRASRAEAAMFQTPDREYYLFEGAIEEVTTAWDGIGGALPTIWWPQDQTWFVHTEIDFDSTYISGSRACVDALLAEPALEVMECQITDSIGVDPFNGFPS